MIKKLNAKRYTLNPNSGQSLVEVLIAIGVGVILIGAAIATIIPVLRSNLETRTVQIAGSLAQEYLDNLRSLAESNWYQVYNPPTAKGSSSQFYLRATSTTYEILSGTTSTVAEGRTFTRYFSIENVNRNLCGASDITANATTSCASGPGSTGVAEDPSTQKITSIVSWTAGGSAAGSINKVQYLTRSQNKVFVQSNWSEGPGQEGPITAENNKFATSTNINYTTPGSILASSLSDATLTSSIFDASVSTGVAINTIMWQGSLAASTTVEFHIASDATSTPASWTYRGPDGSNTTYYAPTSFDLPKQINLTYHNNHRFFRYKIFIFFKTGAIQSPRVDDVIINWSP